MLYNTMHNRALRLVLLVVGELIAALGAFDEDTPVYLRHDGGYTYGGITWDDLEEGSEIE